MKKVVGMVFFGLLDLMIAMLVFIPMRLIKLVSRRPLDELIYGYKKFSENAIVLIHGSGVNEAQFMPARKIIDDLKIDAEVYSCDLNSGGTYSSDKYDSIELYAARAHRYMQNNVSGKNITLIGHSMGGLVAAYLAENYDDIKVDKVITIATPWQGAYMLKYLYGMLSFNTERHKQMVPGSEFLNELKTKAIHNGKEYITVGCSYDFQVLEGCAHIYGGDETRISIASGHIAVIVMPGLWKKLLCKN